jgi:anti-sigma factor RsiW
MDCKRVQGLINAYVDGELELTAALDLEAHLESCAQCRELREQVGGLSRRLREGLTRHVAPAELRERLTLGAASPPAPPAPSTGWQRRQAFALAASVMLAVFASGGTTYWLMRPPASELVAEEVVASHIRSLMPGHLIDVASSDQHTVKPWFDGRVDLAPIVVDFNEQGFPLVGGRLDYIGRQPVAAVVYKRRKHFINVFACPSVGSSAELGAARAWTIRGYNLLSWGAGDINYWMVSDAAASDLEALRRLIVQNGGGTGG